MCFGETSLIYGVKFDPASSSGHLRDLISISGSGRDERKTERGIEYLREGERERDRQNKEGDKERKNNVKDIK